MKSNVAVREGSLEHSWKVIQNRSTFIVLDSKVSAMIDLEPSKEFPVLPFCDRVGTGFAFSKNGLVD